MAGESLERVELTGRIALLGDSQPLFIGRFYHHVLAIRLHASRKGHDESNE